MSKKLNLIGMVLFSVLVLCGANRGLAQEGPATSPPKPLLQPKALQSLAESSIDWLNKEIAPPAEAVGGGGLRVFTHPQMRRSAIKTGATLTLVISLFLLAVVLWRMRPTAAGRTRRKSANEVLAVLGQVPFVNGQQLQLVRLGTRLLLVATSSSGSQTLSEIADPDEVLQIESAYRQGRMDLLTASMQQRALQRPTAGPGVSLGSQPRGGRTLLEA